MERFKYMEWRSGGCGKVFGGSIGETVTGLYYYYEKAKKVVHECKVCPGPTDCQIAALADLDDKGLYDLFNKLSNPPEETP